MAKLKSGALSELVDVAWMAAYGDVDKCVRSFSDNEVIVSLDEVLSDDGIIPGLVHYASHVSLDVSDDWQSDVLDGDVVHMGGEFKGISIIDSAGSLSGLSIDGSIDCSDSVANKLHYLLESVLFLCPKRDTSMYPNVTKAFAYINSLKKSMQNGVLPPVLFDRRGGSVAVPVKRRMVTINV